MVRGRGNFLRSRYLSTAPKICSLFVKYFSTIPKKGVRYLSAVHVFKARKITNNLKKIFISFPVIQNFFRVYSKAGGDTQESQGYPDMSDDTQEN